MKNNNSKGSMIILTIIGIATLLVAVIGATFAYFTATIKYDNKPKEVVVKSGEMVIQFDSRNSIEYTGAIPGRPDVYTLNSDGSKSLITKNRMQFTLSSGQQMSVGTDYDVYLKITNNEFTQSGTLENGNTNLVYFIEEFNNARAPQLTDPTNQNSVPNVLGTIYPTTGLITYDKFKKTELTPMLNENSQTISVGNITGDEGTVSISAIPVNANPENCPENDERYKKEDGACLLKISDGARLGNYGSANEWYFELWLYETGLPQNDDQGKNFKASIEIVTKNQQRISNELTP